MRAWAILLGASATLSGCKSDAAASERIAKSWGAWARCMIGEPLRPNESAKARLRALALAKSAANADKVLADWPGRCGRHRETLQDALAKADVTPERKRLAELVDHDRSLDVELDVLQSIWETAEQLGLQSSGPDEVVSPPAIRLPLSAAALADASIAPDGDTLDSELVQPSELRLIFRGRRPERWSFCTFATGAPPLARAECHAKLPQDSHLTLLDGEAGAPALIRRLREGASEVIDARTAARRGPYVVSGHARKDGSYVGLEPASAKSADLIVVAGGEVKSRTSVREVPEMAGRFLVKKKLAKIPSLEIVAIDSDGKEVAPALEVPNGSVKLVCERPAFTAIAVETIGASATQAVVSFLRSGAWSEPVTQELGSPYARWRCGVDEVTAVWTKVTFGNPSTSKVGRVRCAANGCSAVVHDGPEITAGGTELNLAVDLGSAVGVAWGERGKPLWLVVAPVERLGKATPQVVVEGTAFGGIAWGELELFARDGAGLLLVSDIDHTYAIRFDQSGGFAPLL